MIIRETVVMRIGRTPSGYIIRRKMAESILSKFEHVPIILNKDKQFQCCGEEWREAYANLPLVGYVIGNAKIVGNNVLADVEMLDGCDKHWKGSYNDWLLECEVCSTTKELDIEKIEYIEVY